MILHPVRNALASAVRGYLPKRISAQILAALFLLMCDAVGAAPPSSPVTGGVIVDDGSAEYTGKWICKNSPAVLAGKTYHHDNRMESGIKTAQFTPNLPESGKYEVRLLYVEHENRATNVAVSIISDEGEAKRTVNQRERVLVRGVPRALGVFHFTVGKKGSVLVSSRDADGFVVVDAVQFVPLAIAEAERVAVQDVLIAPRRVRHTSASPAHLRLEWDDVAKDESGYRIWRREVGGAWYLAGETGPNATHFDDGGMQEQTAYEHKVAAWNSNDDGEASPAVVGTTLRMEPHLKPQVLFTEKGTTFVKDPGAVPLKSGEILLAFCEATRKTHHGESIFLVESRDGRSSWPSPRLLLRGDTMIVYGKPALISLQEGRLGMTFSRWSCDEKGKIVGRSRQFITSDDEGTTWSQPVDVGPYSANNQSLIVGQNGRLLESLSDTTGVNKVFASDDVGKSWRLLGTVPGKRLGESALAHVGDGKLVHLSRHEWPFYRLSFSIDNGVTWDKNEPLLYLGGGDNPPKLITLPDGKTLVAIVHSWYPGKKVKDRRQLASVISRDGGRTWDNFRLIGYAPAGDDGFLQHCVIFTGDSAYLFFGGGSRLDTNDGKDLRVLRLSSDFFTSTTAWPYDWRGQPVPKPK